MGKAKRAHHRRAKSGGHGALRLCLPYEIEPAARDPGCALSALPDAALSRILNGTGFGVAKDSSGVIAIVRKQQSAIDVPPMQLAQATPSRAGWKR